MAFLGIVTGMVTAGVIIGFRFTIDVGLGFLPGGDVENFEGLAITHRVIMIMSGAAVLALLLHRYRPSARRVGVVHVMERLSLHQGNLPLKNAVIQFIGGVIALVSGQSGGREGPAIHLGATAASLLGRASKLPNNSLRTMVACGTAAAIASFIPVIVAAVTSTLVTQLVYGTEPAFIIAPLHAYSLLEIPYLILGGLLIGAIAAGYTQLIQAFARLVENRFGNVSLWPGSSPRSLRCSCLKSWASATTP